MSIGRLLPMNALAHRWHMGRDSGALGQPFRRTWAPIPAHLGRGGRPGVEAGGPFELNGPRAADGPAGGDDTDGRDEP